MRTLPLSVRLPQDVAIALKKAAIADTRSTSSMMEKILTDWLREHGYLSQDGVDPVEPPAKTRQKRK